MTAHLTMLDFIEAGVSAPTAFKSFDAWYEHFINVDLPSLGDDAMQLFIRCQFDPTAWVKATLGRDAMPEVTLGEPET